MSSNGDFGSDVPEDAALSAAALRETPLFPLPDVVLFPRAVLPLHIFESRYRVMLTDAIAGHLPIAMALLRPGWETIYRGNPPIDPIVCVGRIIRHEKLEDGRFNLLLEGVVRARIASEAGPSEELDGKPYRVASLTPLVQTRGMEIDLERQRVRMRSILSAIEERQFPQVEEFRRLLDGPASTATIADLLAFHAVQDATTRQSLLAETDVPERVDRLLKIISEQLSSNDRPADSSFN